MIRFSLILLFLITCLYSLALEKSTKVSDFFYIKVNLSEIPRHSYLDYHPFNKKAGASNTFNFLHKISNYIFREVVVKGMEIKSNSTGLGCSDRVSKGLF
jgi:hypothetical protein